MGACCGGCEKRAEQDWQVRHLRYIGYVNALTQPWVEAIACALRMAGTGYEDGFVRIEPAPRHVKQLDVSGWDGAHSDEDGTGRALLENLLGTTTEELPVAVYLKPSLALLPCGPAAREMLQQWAVRRGLRVHATACEDGTPVLLMSSRAIATLYQCSRLPNLPQAPSSSILPVSEGRYPTQLQ